MVSSIRSLLAATVLGVFGAAGAHSAFAQPIYRFDLPAQPLADTLRAIGRETHLNILFDPQSVQSLTVAPIHGLFTATQAIDRALTGTRLAETRTDAHSVLVRPATDRHESAAQTPVAKPVVDPPRRTRRPTGLADRPRLQEVVVTGSNIQIGRAHV